MGDSSSKLRRRTDPVACLAVTLFVAVIALELALASWLPRHLRTERFWGRETALQELVERVDWLRSHMRSRNCRDRWQRGELELALACLDDVARHLREHYESMPREQILVFHADLAFFESAFARWKAGERHLVIEELAPGAWLERQRERLAAATVAEEGAP